MQRDNVDADQQTTEVDAAILRWNILPSEALIIIFDYLSFHDLCRCGQVCKHWFKVESLNFLWKRRFSLDFHTVSNIESSSGHSWKEEYKRLTNAVPCVEYNCITEHNDEVLHVSFSHNGTMFCTCSKDSTVKVFNASEPCDILFSDDLGPNSLFRWSYTQFSQFNSCDTELLVSGRCDGSDSGEILVYAIHLDGFELQARIRIQPYDVMGTWLNESYILSSRCHSLPLHHCLSEVILNKSSQEVHNLRQSIVKRLYMFKNEHATPVAYLKVADMTQVMSKLKLSALSVNYNGEIHEMHLRILLQQAAHDNELSHPLTIPMRFSQTEIRSSTDNNNQTDVAGTDEISRTVDYLLAPSAKRSLHDEHACGKAGQSAESVDNSMTGIGHDSSEVISAINTGTGSDKRPMSYKILLAFTGTDSNLKHQIAMKFITQEKCDDVKPVSIEREQRHVDSSRTNTMQYRSITTDQWDHVIDVGGQLVGMEISQCGQYLFASYRKVINIDSSDRQSQLSISPAVTISVFDLVSMTELMSLNGPSAHSGVDGVFYLFLSCAGEYVASASEDNQGYLWDKYYGCRVSKFEHDDIVNCVAINPCDTSMAVSVSDDHKIKVWRSKGFVRFAAHKEDS